MNGADGVTAGGALRLRPAQRREVVVDTPPSPTRGPTLNSSTPLPPDCVVAGSTHNFTAKVPEFTINLDLPESERWSDVIAATRGPVLELVRHAEQNLKIIPRPIRYLLGLAYRLLDFPHAKEIAAIAKGYGVPVSTVAMLNCSYEMSHLPVGGNLGCTSATAYTPDHGMMHVRTLDWPLPSMGAATCVFHMKKQGREFIVVGVPGQVGVLSGMKPGGYSVTINWAPPGRFPNLQYDPTFLVREVLETCDTYDEAVAKLRDTRLSTSAFFTVCGVKHGEACVIERTQYDAEVRPANADIVVQANHHEAARFVGNNANAGALEGAKFLAESGDRSRVLSAAMHDPNATPCDFAAALDLVPVLNKDTVQKMVFFPASGAMAVWRRIAPDHHRA